MTSSVPVQFSNRAGEMLFGILHRPDDAAAKETAIVLLSPGVKMRVAPHRMYNKMAQAYVEMGYPVFRFDFAGLGDSEGRLDSRYLSVIYNSIQRGRYIDDTRDALDWLAETQGLKTFVVGGLCGGAITGMLTAQDDRRIKGLLALGIPVALDMGDENWAQNLSRGQLEQLRAGYLRKLLDPKSWLRLLTMKSDFKVIWKSLVRRRGGASGAAQHKAPSAAAADPKKAGGDNTNPLFGPAFFAMLESGRPMLHIFSGLDRLAWEFEEKFVDPNRERLRKFEGLYEVHTIDKANHILSHPEWFSEMLRLSRNWLLRFS